MKILQPGQTVIDCGAAPGSWTEIAVTETNANGKQNKKPIGFVIGLDLLSIHPIEVYLKFIPNQRFEYSISHCDFTFKLSILQGANLLCHSDFTQTKTQNRIRELLNGRKIDCVLSDMAPNATGVRSLDQEIIMDLVYNVLRFAVQMSSENANLLVKIWDNGDVKKFEDVARRYYKSIKRIKPEASRGDSAEMFLLAKEFCGIQNVVNSKLDSN